MNPRLYIFFGAPGSGKSTTLQRLSSHVSPSFRVITKETTRPARPTDDEEVCHVDAISQACDIRYTQYGIEYGFASEAVWHALKSGASAGVIVNDIRTVRLLKQRFGVLARAVYIHSNIDRSGVVQLEHERYQNLDEAELSEDIRRRVRKLRTIHEKYIENTALFDYTVLNVGSFEDLYRQLDNIVGDHTLDLRRAPSNVKIFVVAGASYSGKDELVTAMQQMQRERVRLYQKATTRPRRPDDNDELHHMPEDVPPDFDIRYEKQGFTYAISADEVWQELSEGHIALLVVSDQNSIQELRRRFGNVCTTLYLHASADTEVLRERMVASGLKPAEIEKRIAGIRELHDLYVEETALFDHVLLNTAEPEDLYDQAFNILDFYCR